jgi:hypothetical protein
MNRLPRQSFSEGGSSWAHELSFYGMSWQCLPPIIEIHDMNSLIALNGKMEGSPLSLTDWLGGKFFYENAYLF